MAITPSISAVAELFVQNNIHVYCTSSYVSYVQLKERQKTKKGRQ